MKLQLLMKWYVVSIQVKAPRMDHAQMMSINAVMASASPWSMSVMVSTAVEMSQMSSAAVSNVNKITSGRKSQ